MTNQTMYKQLAKYYNLLYSYKDYKKEAEEITILVNQYNKSGGKNLLDVGCGTGKHLEYLIDKYKCMGVDLNQEMLDIAKKRLPDIKFKEANMINMDLGQKFDVIITLFSAIGYVKTYNNLQKTLNNLAKHLVSGGVVIIEPWFTKAEYKVGLPHLVSYESDDVKIVRATVSLVRGDISVLDSHYLIAERNQSVKHFVDKSELGMFDIDKILEIMEKATLNAKYLDKKILAGRGLFIGVKT